MVDYASTSIPKPKNWQDFERCCQILFDCILRDPHVQRNGRIGQPQHGVDVYGRRDSEDTQWVGVQCKGKEEGFGGQVTEKELRAEIDKARTFEPPLAEYFLVTTAPNDAAIQTVARKITDENETSGQPLSVSVWGWGELESHIAEHRRAYQAFHPDVTPHTDEIFARLEDLHEGKELTHRKLDQIAAEVHGIAIGDVGHSATKEFIDKELHAQIDEYRDFISDGRSRTALELLEALRGRAWENASQRVRFRIVTNIGAAKLNLGVEDGAIRDFFAAAKLQSNDPIGMANLALAYLLQRNFPSAIEAAQSALEHDPANSNAASYLIQAHIDNSSVDNPFKLIPKELHDTVAVRLGVINFYRRRNSSQWHNVARESLLLFPESDDLKRAAAEAELDLTVSCAGYLLGEQHPEATNSNRFVDAAAVLQEAWDKLKASEHAIEDNALPQNLAQAYRFQGMNEEAARVIDEALNELPATSDLVKLRAVLFLSAGDEENARTILSNGWDDPEIALLASELELQRDPDRARKALQEISERWIGTQHARAANLIYIESYVENDQLDEALRVADDLTKQHPKDVEILCVVARIQHLKEQEVANETITNTKSILTKNSNFIDRFFVAEMLKRLDRFDEVVEVLYHRS